MKINARFYLFLPQKSASDFTACPKGPKIEKEYYEHWEHSKTPPRIAHLEGNFENT